MGDKVDAVSAGAAALVFWHARVDDPSSSAGPTTYQVSITTNVPAYSAAVTPITARRRYTEFCELRDCLAERQATLLGVSPSTLPLMPPKTIWSTSPSVVSARCAAFEELLNFVGKDERLRDVPVVAAFVGATPFPARTQPVAPASAAAPTPAPVAAAKQRTPVKPLFQDNDPTGDDDASDTHSKRQEAFQSVLNAPEAATPSAERRRGAGGAAPPAAAAAAVVDLTLCGAADAPLTRDVHAAEAVARAAAQEQQRQLAAEQAALGAALQAAAKAKAEAKKKAAAADEQARAAAARAENSVQVPPPPPPAPSQLPPSDEVAKPTPPPLDPVENGTAHNTQAGAEEQAGASRTEEHKTPPSSDPLGAAIAL